MIRLFIIVSFLICLTDYVSYAGTIDSSGLKFRGNTFSVVRIDTIPAYNNTTGNFTLELRFRFSENQPNSEATLLSTRTSMQGKLPSYQGFRVYLNSNNMLIWQMGQKSFSTNYNLQEGKCHHLAIQRNKGNIQTFIDGNLTNSFSCNNPLRFAAPYIQLGADIPDSSTTTFKGTISCLRIWKNARSREAIRQKKDSTINKEKHNLLGYWLLKDSGNNSIKDLSTFENHAYPGISKNKDIYEPDEDNACPYHVTPPEITIEGPDKVCSGKSITLHAKGDTSYSWHKSSRTDDTLSRDSVFSTRITSSQTFILRSKNGGKASIHITAKTGQKCHPVEVYEFITPNGDNKNDFFHIKNIQHYSDHKVLIFNKEGEKVFYSKNYKNNWQGGNLPSGVYYYSVEIPEIQKSCSGQLMIRK